MDPSHAGNLTALSNGARESGMELHLLEKWPVEVSGSNRLWAGVVGRRLPWGHSQQTPDAASPCQATKQRLTRRMREPTTESLTFKPKITPYFTKEGTPGPIYERCGPLSAPLPKQEGEGKGGQRSGSVIFLDSQPAAWKQAGKHEETTRSKRETRSILDHNLKGMNRKC